MTFIQQKQIKKLQFELKDLKSRIKYDCWDCMGRQNYQNFDCKMPNCSLYKVRPKSIYGYHPPKKYRAI